jgi:hypothetical protein
MGVAWSAGRIRTAVNLSFLNPNHYVSFKYLLSYPQEAKSTSFQAHCFSENLVASEIEPGTSVSAASLSDH